MDNKQILLEIDTLVKDIKEKISQLDINNKEYIYDYKLSDIVDTNNIIRKCRTCGKEFVPSNKTRGSQCFCGDECRYYSTKEHKHTLKQDARYIKIDNLRKLIYERRYRAKRDGKEITQEQSKIFDYVIAELKKLTHTRNQISLYEFNKRYNELAELYSTSRVYYRKIL